MTPGAAGKATTGSTVPSDRGAWPSSATRGFSHQPRGWGLAGQWHRVLQHRRCVGSEWPPLCPGSRPDTCLLGRSGRSSWAHRRPLLSAWGHSEQARPSICRRRRSRSTGPSVAGLAAGGGSRSACWPRVAPAWPSPRFRSIGNGPRGCPGPAPSSWGAAPSVRPAPRETDAGAAHVAF